MQYIYVLVPENSTSVKRSAAEGEGEGERMESVGGSRRILTTPLYVNPAWDSMRIILNEKKAIKLSIFHQNCRVEIFEIDADGTYIPSLNYYKAGIFITPYN